MTIFLYTFKVLIIRLLTAHNISLFNSNNNNNSEHNNPLRAMSTSSQTEVNDHPSSLRVMYDQHAKSPATLGFLDQNYCFKSVVTHVHDARFGTDPIN